MNQKKLKIIYLKAEDLILLANNPRRLNDPEAISKLKKLIKAHGFQNPLQVYKEKSGKYTILCGNHRFLAARELGINNFPCIEYTGSRKQAFARALSDNKSSEWTEWDYPLLNAELAELQTDDFDIELTGFDENEVEELLGNGFKDTAPQIDKAEELNKKWGIKMGDLWQIGQHRLLCGDATQESDVVRVMGQERADMVFTDSPYGVSYADKNQYLNTIFGGNRIQKKILGDHKTVEDLADTVIYPAFCRIREILADRTSYYITAPQGGELLLMMMRMMQKAGLTLRHMLIWVKNGPAFDRTDYNYQHEPILYGWIKNHRFFGKGQYKSSTWEIDRTYKNDLHPTMKPIALIINAILNSCPQGGIIADFFGGSGSSMVAAENTGVRCRMMELSQDYCAVIIQRMKNTFPDIEIKKL